MAEQTDARPDVIVLSPEVYMLVTMLPTNDGTSEFPVGEVIFKDPDHSSSNTPRLVYPLAANWKELNKKTPSQASETYTTHDPSKVPEIHNHKEKSPSNLRSQYRALQSKHQAILPNVTQDIEVLLVAIAESYHTSTRFFTALVSPEANIPTSGSSPHDYLKRRMEMRVLGSNALLAEALLCTCAEFKVSVQKTRFRDASDKHQQGDLDSSIRLQDITNDLKDAVDSAQAASESMVMLRAAVEDNEHWIDNLQCMIDFEAETPEQKRVNTADMTVLMNELRPIITENIHLITTKPSVESIVFPKELSALKEVQAEMHPKTCPGCLKSNFLHLRAGIQAQNSRLTAGLDPEILKKRQDTYALVVEFATLKKKTEELEADVTITLVRGEVYAEALRAYVAIGAREWVALLEFEDGLVSELGPDLIQRVERLRDAWKASIEGGTYRKQ